MVADAFSNGDVVALEKDEEVLRPDPPVASRGSVGGKLALINPLGDRGVDDPANLTDLKCGQGAIFLEMSGQAIGFRTALFLHDFMGLLE